MSECPYDEEYFLRGVQSGKSNYENYSYVPALTLPLAAAIRKFLGITDGETVLDFGCARGYLVKALRLLGTEARGVDISTWAINNCDPDVREFVGYDLPDEPMSFDHVVAKDVCEHIPQIQLVETLTKLAAIARKSVFIIVPLAKVDGGPYVCPRDEQDRTHVIRYTLATWIALLESVDRRMVASGGFYAPNVKQFNSGWPQSCGFLTLRRI